jgi:hypothetical protein
LQILVGSRQQLKLHGLFLVRPYRENAFLFQCPEKHRLLVQAELPDFVKE